VDKPGEDGSFFYDWRNDPLNLTDSRARRWVRCPFYVRFEPECKGMSNMIATWIIGTFADSME
jgi:hypothetical protein